MDHDMKMMDWMVPVVCYFAFASIIQSEEPIKTSRNIEYGRVEGHVLKLDLYLPQENTTPPLIVWVHGGAWRGGSKDGMPLKSMVERGWAVASVDYRLTPVAPFPAQIHDIKAAIRFLRAQAQHYRYLSDKIIIAGASAGGHLAALVGTTNDHPTLEGSVGDYPEESSSVQGILDFYGASNLTTILNQSTPHGLGVRIPALQLLLGGQPEDRVPVARLASPVYHVDSKDPPLMLIHGDQDPQMPINQAHELQGAYQREELPVEFEVIHGAAHGGAEFYDSRRLRLISTFLKRHLNLP